MTETIVDAIARVVDDPGSVVGRWSNEPVAQWTARALVTLLEVPKAADVGDELTVGSPATYLLMDNALLRAGMEGLHQDIIMWRNRARDAEKALGMGVSLDV